MSEYYFARTLEMPFETAVAHVTEVLKRKALVC